MSGILNIAIKAAYNAAKFIQRAARNSSQLIIQEKGPNNFVTDVDQQAEKIIIDTIKTHYPKHGIIAEESGFENITHEYVWIIDAIDGTTNFLHGNPHYSISIGVRQQGKIVNAVILEPNNNNVYTASLGKGAYLNDTRIRVNTVSKLSNAILASSTPVYYPELLDQYTKVLKDMLHLTHGQRIYGSSALNLAYVASGIIDGTWEISLKPWDFAAGYLILKESGGMLIDFKNTQNFWDNGNIIASNSKLISQIQKIIHPYFC